MLTLLTTPFKSTGKETKSASAKRDVKRRQKQLQCYYGLSLD